MIQVCSRCGTRWNVRDRERQWCPRCRGALLAPSGHAPGAEWSAPVADPQSAVGSPPVPPEAPPGHRWIAVRPGSPPPRRRRRGPLGPTPRYATIPHWGLVEYFGPDDPQQEVERSGPSVKAVRRLLFATTVAYGVAAFMLLIRYVLLLINRSTLLNPWLADGVTWFGIVAAVVAFFLLVATAIVLTNWLVARRAAAFAHRGQTDPRSPAALRWGCLLPFVNQVWAPVYVLDLARAENRISLMRRPVVVWSILWFVCTLVSVFAVATSFPDTAQGVADNTVTTTIAYLLAVAVLLVTKRVHLGFESVPVQRATRRWVMVPDEHAPLPDDRSAPGPTTDSAVPVETEGQHPAA